MDAFGIHGLSCYFSNVRHSRHAVINDIIKRSLNSVTIPCHIEPARLYRSVGKRPDGASVLTWKGERVLVWDATCPDTLAPSHLSMAVKEAGAVTHDAEYRKKQKYSHLDYYHYFVLVAIETLGALRDEARAFLKEVGRCIQLATEDNLPHHYLLQCISVAMQRRNAAAVLGCIEKMVGKLG